MSLPIYKDDNKNLMLLQNNWSSALDPLIENPICSSLLLKGVSLSSGSNQINHRLGRKLEGWFIVRQRSAGTVYDTQDTNQNPKLTLLLTASAAMTVDLCVF